MQVCSDVLEFKSYVMLFLLEFWFAAINKVQFNLVDNLATTRNALDALFYMF